MTRGLVLFELLGGDHRIGLNSDGDLCGSIERLIVMLSLSEMKYSTLVFLLALT